jgi:tRNA(fMet)-specific endonuclease VapC
MAALIDASIFIAAARGHIAYGAVTTHLEKDEAALAAITASELLAGVHQADTPERRMRREALVEQVLASLPVLAFDLQAARLYARLAPT